MNDRKLKHSLDSEVYLHFVVSNLHKDVRDTFRKSVTLIKQKYDHSSLTCIFSDGAKLYAYREFTKRPDYYTLYQTKLGNSTIICSEPVSDRLSWQLLKKGQLLIV